MSMDTQAAFRELEIATTEMLLGTLGIAGLLFAALKLLS